MMRGVLLVICSVFAGGLVLASSFPQGAKLKAKEAELAAIQQLEKSVLNELEDARACYHALRNDTEYLELHARDRLGLHLPGETIYQIDRDR